MKLARLHDGPEIFFTLQGEGPSIGMPAIFIRASLCNLHCHWCDTDYTWNFAGTPWPHQLDARPGYRKHRKEDVILELDPAEILPYILRYPCRRLVLTGGEPLLQQDEWLELIRLLPGGEPWQIEVETNGTRIPSPELSRHVTQFNVSPKLAHSGMPASTRLHPQALRHFASLSHAFFKFVASSPDDFPEIAALQEEFSIPSARLLVMPEGKSPATLDLHARAVAEACLHHGWRFGDRLHVRLWGDRRGV